MRGPDRPIFPGAWRAGAGLAGQPRLRRMLRLACPGSPRPRRRSSPSSSRRRSRRRRRPRCRAFIMRTACSSSRSASWASACGIVLLPEIGRCCARARWSAARGAEPGHGVVAAAGPPRRRRRWRCWREPIVSVLFEHGAFSRAGRGGDRRRARRARARPCRRRGVAGAGAALSSPARTPRPPLHRGLRRRC